MAVDYLALVERAVNYIENNLTNELSLAIISDEVELSIFHFQRVFLSIVGESPCDYVRRRRLTLAAQDLLGSDVRVLDIALQYQFGSQEAFTRAFKSYFGLTPGKYRRQKHSLFIEKPRLTKERLTKLVTGLTLQPEFAEKPGFTLAGLRCYSRFSDNCLPQLWNNLVSQTTRMQFPKPPIYAGIYEYLSNVGFSCETEFTYLAGIRADLLESIPGWMTTRTVPPAKYAIFTRKDTSVTREDAYQYIFGAWFPKSKCGLAELDTLEYYDTCAPGSHIEVKICIPIL